MYAFQVGGRHPTGMLSCLNYFSSCFHFKVVFIALLLTSFIAHKRSLGQDNVFTGVCLSTGGVSQHALAQEAVYPSMQWAGGVTRGSVTRGMCDRKGCV